MTAPHSSQTNAHAEIAKGKGVTARKAAKEKSVKAPKVKPPRAPQKESYLAGDEVAEPLIELIPDESHDRLAASIPDRSRNRGKVF